MAVDLDFFEILCSSYISDRYCVSWIVRVDTETLSVSKSGAWNYQILLSADKQMLKIHLSNQDLLAAKIDLFSLFLEENIRCGYSLEAPRRGASNEYPQRMFSSRNEKYICLIIWILFLARDMNYCPRTSKLKFLTSPQGNGTSWTSRAWYLDSSV